MHRRAPLAALTLLAFATQPGLAAAEDACPTGNLIAGKKPSRWKQAFNAERLTDGVVATEGDYWRTSLTAHLAKDAKSGGLVVYDLGHPIPVHAALLQADNNDLYTLELSNDRETWEPLWTAGAMAGEGMRTRYARDLDGTGRYLRLTASGGDNAYSLGELQVFCAVPADWPPKLKVQKGKASTKRTLGRNERNANYKLVISALGLGLFALLLLAERPRRENDPWDQLGLPVALAVATTYHILTFRRMVPVPSLVTSLALLAILVGLPWLRAKRPAVWPRVERALWVVVAGFVLVHTLGLKLGMQVSVLLGVVALWSESIARRWRLVAELACLAAVIVACGVGWSRSLEPTAGVAGISVTLLLLAVRRDYAELRPYLVPVLVTAMLVWVFGQTYGKPGVAAAIVFAIGVTALILQRRRQGKPWSALVERVALVAVLVACGHAWTNFGKFHGTVKVHRWDIFHYYMGAKYFAENGYQHLYHCGIIAELDAGRRENLKKRKVRNLTTNLLDASAPVLATPEVCREAFGWPSATVLTREEGARAKQVAELEAGQRWPAGAGPPTVRVEKGHAFLRIAPDAKLIGRAAGEPVDLPDGAGQEVRVEPGDTAGVVEGGNTTSVRWAHPARWQAWQNDVELFRKVMGSGSWWERLFHDHGYNATPVWTLIGRLIARGPPASQSVLNRVALIDAALYASIFLLILWAFGLRAAALAMIVWATGYPWAFFWTGGAFGRIPWLFMAVAGVCLLKKRYFLLGGAGLAWSLLLRIFPGALFGGVALQVAYNLFTKRTIVREHRRFIAGAAGAFVLLFGLSVATVGADAWPEFLRNSLKHKATALTNYMGVPTLISFHPDRLARKTKNPQAADPFQEWKTQHNRTIKERWPITVASLLALFALIFYVGRHVEAWEVTALSTLLIVGIFELTCYYFNFVVLLAPFALREVRYTLAFIGMAIATQVVQLRVGWIDEEYLWESVIVVGVMVWMVADFAVGCWRETRARDASGEPEPAPA